MDDLLEAYAWSCCVVAAVAIGIAYAARRSRHRGRIWIALQCILGILLVVLAALALVATI